MAVLAQVVAGAVQIGDETSPDYSVTITATGGTVTEDKRNKVVLATASTLTIDLSDLTITKATFFWCRIKDTNGDPANCAIEINNSGATDIPDVSECLIAMKSASTGITQVEITNATGANVTIEYIISG